MKRKTKRAKYWVLMRKDSDIFYFGSLAYGVVEQSFATRYRTKREAEIIAEQFELSDYQPEAVR
jgi:hypothetical protein